MTLFYPSSETRGALFNRYLPINIAIKIQKIK